MVEERIAAMEHRILEALAAADWDALAALLRDDFVITTAGWLQQPADRDTWLTEVQRSATLTDFSVDSVETRHYGDVAVALVSSTQAGEHSGHPYRMAFRYTDVWVREEEGWRLAVRHATGRAQ
jgi:ketosteroid isomerase-like protein